MSRTLAACREEMHGYCMASACGCECHGYRNAFTYKGELVDGLEFSPQALRYLDERFRENNWALSNHGARLHYFVAVCLVDIAAYYRDSTPEYSSDLTLSSYASVQEQVNEYGVPQALAYRLQTRHDLLMERAAMHDATGWLAGVSLHLYRNSEGTREWAQAYYLTVR